MKSRPARRHIDEDTWVNRSAGKGRSREIAHYGGSKSAKGTVRLVEGRVYFGVIQTVNS
jgi:hypothetical protein